MAKVWAASMGLAVAGFILACSPSIDIVSPVMDAGTLLCESSLHTDCDDGPGLSCVDTQIDASHCGGCGMACESAVCVGGDCCVGDEPTSCVVDGLATCVDVATDVAHCGTCDHACGQAAACVGGECCSGVVCGNACLGDSYVVQRTLGPSECLSGVLQDLDGDGYDDAIYGCQLGESLEIYWGNAAGILGDPFSLDAGRVSPHMGFGDVDEDGYKDIVVAVQGMGPPYTDRLRTFFGGPSRSFPRQADVMLDGNPRTMVLADLDHDGHLDVLIDRPQAADPCMYLLPGNGRGLFDTVAPACIWSIPAFADDNGSAGVLSQTATRTRIARTSVNSLFILELDAAGAMLNAARHPVDGLSAVSSVSVVDADGDDELDIVAVGLPTDAGAAVVIVRNNAALGECPFDSEFAPKESEWALWISGAGDFNGDGLIDMTGRAACCYQPTSTIDLYLRAWPTAPDFQ